MKTLTRYPKLLVACLVVGTSFSHSLCIKTNNIKMEISRCGKDLPVFKKSPELPNHSDALISQTFCFGKIERKKSLDPTRQRKLHNV